MLISHNRQIGKSKKQITCDVNVTYIEQQLAYALHSRNEALMQLTDKIMRRGCLFDYEIEEFFGISLCNNIPVKDHTEHTVSCDTVAEYEGIVLDWIQKNVKLN